jgi:hypothetical protein
LAEGIAMAVRAREGALPLGPGRVVQQALARRMMTTLGAMLGEEVFVTRSATVALHPEPAFRMAPGPRTLWVLPLAEGAADALAPIAQVASHLSSLAVVGVESQGALRLLPKGVRVCLAGELQSPALFWFQDGLHPLRSLLRP